MAAKYATPYGSVSPNRTRISVVWETVGMVPSFSLLHVPRFRHSYHNMRVCREGEGRRGGVRAGPRFFCVPLPPRSFLPPLPEHAAVFPRPADPRRADPE